MYICVCMYKYTSVYTQKYIYIYTHNSFNPQNKPIYEVDSMFITLLIMRKVRHKAQYPTATKFRG